MYSHNELSERLSITSAHFEDSGKIQVRSGEESPYTTAEILKMDWANLIHELKTFKSDSWLGPTIRGFSSALEQAVIQFPDKFVLDIDKFIDSPYIYVYSILSGLQNVWKAKTVFDWEKVLTFCSNYISSKSYGSGKLSFDADSWKFSSDSVEGQIANLIEEGTRSDDWAFEIGLVPKAEEILSFITRKLNSTDLSRLESPTLDYPTFAINTTQGKVFRALLDCALRNRRNNVLDNWLSFEKPLFINGIERGMLEVDVFIGWYFRQFYYLDEVWVGEYLTQLSNKNYESWKAFMGGYLFPNPTSNRAIFDLMVPHYKLAIEKKFIPKNFGAFNNGLTRHLGCYYFWSFEDLVEGSLIKDFIDNGSAEGLSDLVHFFRIQKDYVKQLTDPEKVIFKGKIILFWKYVLSKLEKTGDEPYVKVVGQLSDLIIYFEELNEEIFELVRPSLKLVATNHGWHFIQEQFIQILKTNNSVSNSKIIARLFIELLKNTTPYYREEDIKFIVNALFTYGESKPLANEICEIYLRRGLEFLRPIHDANNP